MKHRLSFGHFNILSENILEVVADEGVEMTLEMIEECHQFVDKHFADDFGMLVNRVNNYTYSFEAKLSIASYAHLKAIAFVYYSPDSKDVTEDLYQLRAFDEWNFRAFSGLELGWQQAYNWLQQELTTVKMS
ncbi:MAG: hypothetical protein P8I03_03510 [Thalassotalea sp.]|nr:hypothetical protein [Thalassotalea sp.]